MTTSTRHFVRHYVEMLLAMFLGMLVLGGPAMLALGAAGVSSAELKAEAPALLLLGMGVTMTVPMVAWMRHRGHGWAPSNENHYTIQSHLPLPDPLAREQKLGDLLAILAGRLPESSGKPGSPNPGSAALPWTSSRRTGKTTSDRCAELWADRSVALGRWGL
jgi:hypothetical protein